MEKSIKEKVVIKHMECKEDPEEWGEVYCYEIPEKNIEA